MALTFLTGLKPEIFVWPLKQEECWQHVQRRIAIEFILFKLVFVYML